jgi:hypothetical protein
MSWFVCSDAILESRKEQPDLEMLHQHLLKHLSDLYQNLGYTEQVLENILEDIKESDYLDKYRLSLEHFAEDYNLEMEHKYELDLEELDFYITSLKLVLSK